MWEKEKLIINPFPNDKLDASKLKNFEDANSKYDENGRKFSKMIKKTLWEKEKLLVTSNFSFSYSVFKRLGLQTRKNQGLFGKGLNSGPGKNCHERKYLRT